MRYQLLRRLTVVILLAGCDTLGITEACTLIGCPDGISVGLNGNVPAVFTLRATAGSESFEQTCNNPSCRSTIFIPISAATVRIEIITPTGSTSHEINPRYEDIYPNGRDCGAACQQARVTITL